MVELVAFREARPQVGPKLRPEHCRGVSPWAAARLGSPFLGLALGRARLSVCFVCRLRLWLGWVSGARRAGLRFGRAASGLGLSTERKAELCCALGGAAEVVVQKEPGRRAGGGRGEEGVEAWEQGEQDGRHAKPSEHAPLNFN